MSEDAHDPDCTDCGGSGITFQTERFCSCDKGIALKSASTSKLRFNGIGRNAEWPKSLLVYFDRVPTDWELRFLSGVLARACACMPRASAEVIHQTLPGENT